MSDRTSVCRCSCFYFKSSDKLKETLNKYFRRGRSECSPAFQGRESQTKYPRRVATPEINTNSIVATRRDWLTNLIPALKRRAKLIRRYASKALDQIFLKFVGQCGAALETGW